MMHTFRLLEMAIEIGLENKINVKRPNREFLLSVKEGRHEYNDLLEMAEERKMKMEQVFERSILPDKPDIKKANDLLFSIRDKFYD